MGTPFLSSSTDPSPDEEAPIPTSRIWIPLPPRGLAPPQRSSAQRSSAQPATSHHEPSPSVWRRLRIGEETIRVCEKGYLILRNGITYGYALIGTPYRTVPVGDKEYYVHDLVWRAFHGDPPPGYEVRHTYAATMTPSRTYDNALQNLQICQTQLVYNPRFSPATLPIATST